jgi:hypothetical protein
MPFSKTYKVVRLGLQVSSMKILVLIAQVSEHPTINITDGDADARIYPSAN